MNVSLTDGPIGAHILTDLFYSTDPAPTPKLASGVVKNTGSEAFFVYVNGTESTIQPGAQQFFYASRVQIKGGNNGSYYTFAYVLV